jgi:hypothetical protein
MDVGASLLAAQVDPARSIIILAANGIEVQAGGISYQ